MNIRERLATLRKIADDHAKYPDRWLVQDVATGTYSLTGEPQEGDAELIEELTVRNGQIQTGD